VFEENDVEGWTARKSVAYCEACDRDIKRTAPSLPLPEEQRIGNYSSKEETRYHDIISIFISFSLFSV